MDRQQKGSVAIGMTSLPTSQAALLRVEQLIGDLQMTGDEQFLPSASCRLAMI
ncbi:hypothetical protein LNQ52_07580 [Klebsiella pneumoniae subsp. pneumoniae]|nr:hypothetical protein [Klebsiella pneumoniae subsp. pneumoniae]